MIKFLLDRPISTLVTFTVFIVLGVFAYLKIPTSLLPNIPVPEIVVQLTGKGLSAREIENTAVAPLRRLLMQAGNLQDIQSETRNEQATIRLLFDYGTRMDLAFVEVNEKVDNAMNYLPSGITRPQVVKVNTSDLPVFDLLLTLRDSTHVDEASFLQLSELAEQVIKRRLEQLEQVAMVDYSGVVEKQLLITPNNALMQTLSLTERDIEQAFNDNNLTASSALLRSGNYAYNVAFSTALRTPEDVADIYLRSGDRVIQLKDIATVRLVANSRLRGEVLYNGQPAIALSVIKQANARIDDLQQRVQETLTTFEKHYPQIAFHLTNDQAKLLDITIGNLQQELLLGLLLITLITLVFFRHRLLPLVIALSLLVALVISFFFLYLFNISFNIVSLAGLVLSVGMMIDNGIVVTDNITQARLTGLALDEACVRGTNEVITPMLSSMLTTVAVFFPLLFMSGIAGAIFYDQALAITLSLAVSYMVGITLVPVLYKVIVGQRVVKPVGTRSLLMRAYECGIGFTFAHKRSLFVITLLSIPLCGVLFYAIGKEKMPTISHDEIVVKVAWNENVLFTENSRRTQDFLKTLAGKTTTQTAFVGQQQFLIGKSKSLQATETKLYLKAISAEAVPGLQEHIQHYFQKHYPQAAVSILPPETAFDEIFDTDAPDLLLALYPRTEGATSSQAHSQALLQQVETATLERVQPLVWAKTLQLHIDKERLLLYGVSYDALVQALRDKLGENRFATLQNTSEYIPVQLSREQGDVEDLLEQLVVSGYPVRQFVWLSEDTERQAIVAKNDGEYLPLCFPTISSDKTIDKVQAYMRTQTAAWDYNLSGAYFQNQEMLSSLLIILLVSLVMMYLILVAQFESFLQPLILFAEIPIDIAVALACLWACGHTLNLMSAIGIIVTCGIIVNDSILKIDVINQLRTQGEDLMTAIHEAGRRRLRAIVMTALTSIFALTPVFFGSDMGSQLQLPLAIAMVGAMVIGTIVSLFLIPLFYWKIYSRASKTKAKEGNAKESTCKTNFCS